MKTSKEAILAINKLISALGSQSEAAKSLNISPQYLGDIIRGGRPVSDNVAKKLGFKWELVKK